MMVKLFRITTIVEVLNDAKNFVMIDKEIASEQNLGRSV